jgi:DNA-binding CsgD family transcriptional regulator
MILDATVNPDTSSRAGFFFRNMEPNALTYSASSIYFLRGPIALARERNIFMLPQWLMEFPVTEGDFFHTATAGADASKPLSRTYYWNPSETLTHDYEDAMLLCVPLVAPDGTVLGICGLEVNELLFKMQYRPDTSVFVEAATVFAPVMEDGSLNTALAMFSGGQPLHGKDKLAVSAYRRGLSLFTSDGNRYVGLSAEVKLYSKNTVQNGKWAMAVVVPEDDLTAYAAEKSHDIIVLLFVLLVCAVILSVVLSKRYVKPIADGLRRMKEQNFEARSGVTEINDLMEFLAEQDKLREIERKEMEHKLRSQGVRVKEPEEKQDEETYEHFIRGLKSLTKAEREVFDLYVDGYTATEISEVRVCSINTIKTHNQHIYDKLGVASREGLLRFVQMMRDKGVSVHGTKRNK